MIYDHYSRTNSNVSGRARKKERERAEEKALWEENEGI
jgi:hypothetical protein